MVGQSDPSLMPTTSVPQVTRRQRVIKVIRPAIGTLVVAAVTYAVVSQWSDVTKAIHSLAWQSVALAFVMVLLGMAGGVMSWRALLREEGYPLGILSAAMIVLVGQLGKYLPGSVWSVLLQMDLAKREGVPPARTFTATLCWMGLGVSSALTVGLFGLPVLVDAGQPLAWVMLGLLPIALICSHPKVLTRLVDLALRLLRRDPLPHSFTWRGVSEAFGWSLFTWFCYGTHLWLLANALGAPGWSGFMRCLGGFAMAMTAGVLFVLAPSGAGIREGLIVSALAGAMVRGEALGIAVVSRMLFTISDVALAGLAGLWAWHILRDERSGKGHPVNVRADRLGQRP